MSGAGVSLLASALCRLSDSLSRSASRPDSSGSSCRLHRRGLTALLPCLLVAVAALIIVGEDAYAQEMDSNCDNSTPGDPIKCVEVADSTAGVTIDLSGVTITSTDEDPIKIGIEGISNISGTGAIDIDVKSSSTITVKGAQARGILGQKQLPASSGDISIDVRGSTITATQESGNAAIAIAGIHSGRTSGDVSIDVRNSAVATHGRGRAIVGDAHSGDVDIYVEGGSVDAGGTGTGEHPAIHGIGRGRQTGIDIEVKGASISTAGTNRSDGIYANFQERFGNDLSTASFAGDINIEVNDATISTAGTLSNGIYADFLENPVSSGANAKFASGDINIKVLGSSTITTSGTALYQTFPGTYSYGIRVDQGNARNRMAASSGDIVVELGKGSSITTAGASSHGIVTYQFPSDITPPATPRSMAVTVGGSITVSGARARGVQMGTVSGGAPIRVANRDMKGYLHQTVTVNGAIDSTAEGVYLAGGGRVIIGPTGSITSGSGIAILATGTVPEDSTDPQNILPAIPPKLRVDLNLDGRQVADAIGDDWILNDGGETTIAMNGTVLHDGATGVTGNTAPNGAWNVSMVAGGGVKVTDRANANPAMWTVSARAEDVISGRDFTATDFSEEEMPPPPPPPPPLPEPLPEMVEAYAPRAALYEALPDFLLGLQPGALAGHSLSFFAPLSERSEWIQLWGHTGSRDFDRSTVGTQYDTTHRVVQIGGKVWERPQWAVLASLHHVIGSATVASPVKGGDINATGVGLSLDAHWRNAHDYYVAGGVSWTDYHLDIASDTAGQLISRADAERLGLHVETGRRLLGGGPVYWTPHIRLGHSRVQVASFTDAVAARASFPVADRNSARVGLKVDTVQGTGNSARSLWGSLDIERGFGGMTTTAHVSGETLRADPKENGVSVAVGSSWQRGPWVMDVALTARPGSGSHAWSGLFNVGMRF